MCRDCGCGLPGENPAGVSAVHGHEHEHDHEHEHGPGHHHGEEHDHSHSHTHRHAHSHGSVDHQPLAQERRVVEVRQAILEKNDRLAERNRGFFHARGVLVLNILSSPGSGKTTFLQETLRSMGGKLKAGLVVGDLATDNDARRLRGAGAPVVQITTGTVCHLDSEMVARAVQQLPLDHLELLFIENVGNLVCPASYDLGEDLRVVLLSVTEGEDKPLKYPPIFQAADAVIISKSDLAQACGYDRAGALANIRRVAPKARIFELSAKTGEGMEPWRQFLLEKHQATKSCHPLAC
ncbi:MAG TPA: hydrogenase nickel incorporation protein HypB [Verrucomicrobiae bacterium]|nr:hydrogenase nickel incorporation protein HypB [Verrucomicrobiae bacterium]